MLLTDKELARVKSHLRQYEERHRQYNRDVVAGCVYHAMSNWTIEQRNEFYAMVIQYEDKVREPL